MIGRALQDHRQPPSHHRRHGRLWWWTRVRSIRCWSRCPRAWQSSHPRSPTTALRSTAAILPCLTLTGEVTMVRILGSSILRPQKRQREELTPSGTERQAGSLGQFGFHGADACRCPWRFGMCGLKQFGFRGAGVWSVRVRKSEHNRSTDASNKTKQKNKTNKKHKAHTAY